MLCLCPDCGAEMPETAAFCPGCGRPMLFASRAEASVGVLHENFAGALAYLTFVPAILFLILEPYKQNRFVRFHSVQCLLLWLAGVLLTIVVKLTTILLLLIPVAGPLLVILISVLATLAAAVIWLVLVVKALQGEMYRFPVLGDFAERCASTGA